MQKGVLVDLCGYPIIFFPMPSLAIGERGTAMRGTEESLRSPRRAARAPSLRRVIKVGRDMEGRDTTPATGKRSATQMRSVGVGISVSGGKSVTTMRLRMFVIRCVATSAVRAAAMNRNVIQTRKKHVG